MTRRAILGLTLAALAWTVPSHVFAARIKLATLVPDGSVWHKSLRQMGAEWKSTTDGRISLTIYPGGVQGDDPEIVRKMRLGQLHAATLTVAGLAEIAPAFEALGVPLIFESYEEFNAVLAQLEPLLKAKLEAKGFVLLNWGHGGWVHLFSKKPIRSVGDLRAQKIFVWAGDDRRVQLWSRNGFEPVPLAATDIMTGLQTGMIEVYPAPTLAALSLQWFRQTPYMLDYAFSPLLGGTVITKRAWDRVSAEDQARLLTAAAKMEEDLDRTIPEQEKTAIDEMAKRGLELTTLENEAEWMTAAESFWDYARREIVPTEVFDQLIAYRDAYRRQGVEESH